MKKIIPFVSPVAFGFLGGGMVACVICALSIVSSPFAAREDSLFLGALIMLSILSVLLVAMTGFFNVKYLIDLDDRRKARLIFMLEAFVSCALFFVFWNAFDPIIKCLYDLF